MAIEIKAPPFPESVADGTVATWHKVSTQSCVCIYIYRAHGAGCEWFNVHNDQHDKAIQWLIGQIGQAVRVTGY